MAKRVILAPEINMLDVILDKSAEKTVTLNSAERAFISSQLDYASKHGPALYGMKSQRNSNPNFDQFILETKEKIDSNHPVYTPFNVVQADEGEDSNVTLTGPETRLLRSMLKWAHDKGHDLFSVTKEDEDEYNSFVSNLLNTLSV